MAARWVLVFSVQAPVAPRLADRLESAHGVVVSTQATETGSMLLSMEVVADPAVVDVIVAEVRQQDENAERMHSSVIMTPELDASPATAAVDFAASDEPSPCGHCLTWRHEHVVADDGETVLREWHRPDCPTYTAWL